MDGLLFFILLYSPVCFEENLAPPDSINIQKEKEGLLNMLFLCLVTKIISFQVHLKCRSLGEAVVFLRPCYSSLLGVAIALGTCIFQYMSHSIFAFLSSSQTLSSWRVEMLNRSLSNICVQLRSNQAFKISVSWRRKGENSREAIWASRRYFGVRWMWASEGAAADRIQLAEWGTWFGPLSVPAHWVNLPLTVSSEMLVISFYS